MTEIECGGESNEGSGTETSVLTRRKRSSKSIPESISTLEEVSSGSKDNHKYWDGEFSPPSTRNENTFRHRRNSPLRVASSSSNPTAVPPGSNPYNEFDPYVFDPDKSFGPSLDPS